MSSLENEFHPQSVWLVNLLALVSFVRNLNVNFTRALGNWEEEAFLKLRLGFKKASKKALV